MSRLEEYVFASDTDFDIPFPVKNGWTIV